MYFGSTAFKAQNNTVTESVLDFGSVVYNEYLNRKSMLEGCNDEVERPLLEAQVEVLCEVSLKDVAGRIKKFINSIIEKIKKFIKKLKDIFSNKELKDKISALEKEKEELRKANEALEKEVKNKDNQVKSRDDKIINDNTRFNKIFMDIQNNPLLYFNADKYVQSSGSLANAIEILNLNKGHNNIDIKDRDIQKINDAAREILPEMFEEFFEEKEVTIWADGEDKKVLEISIVSSFDHSSAIKRLEKDMNSNKEIHSSHNDFLWMYDKIKAASETYDGDYVYNALYRLQDAMNKLNNCINLAENGGGGYGTDLRFSVFNMIKHTSTAVNDMFIFVQHVDELLIKRRQFLIISANNLLTMCKALKNEIPGEAQGKFENLNDKLNR